MFWRPTSLFLRLIWALWLLELEVVTRVLLRSWTCAGALLRVAGAELFALLWRVVLLGFVALLCLVWPEGVTIFVRGSLLRETDELEEPEEPVRVGVVELPLAALFELLVAVLCSFLVALPELPPPVRRFWLCASKGVVHIIAMQSISTTQVIFFIISKY